MFEQTGYIGNKRSVRSMAAIEEYEVPMSHINKDLIEEFIDDFPEYSSLKDIKVAIWRLVAKSIGESSWHHVGKYFNECNHYSLHEIADQLMEFKEKYIEKHRKALEEKKRILEQERVNIRFAVIEWQEWGGTRNHPRVVGTEQDAGVIKGDWVHTFMSGKKKAYGSNVLRVDTFTKWSELTKSYPDFKGNYKRACRLMKWATK